MLPTNVRILFDGQEVPHIMRTLVWVWNAGNSTLRGEDIVSKDQLRLAYNSKTQVLSVRVLKVTREALGFVAAPGDIPSMVFINFDYLDRKDGALIEILHTGKGLPGFYGTIKGVPSIWIAGKNTDWRSLIKEGEIIPSPSFGMSLIIAGAALSGVHTDVEWLRGFRVAVIAIGVVLVLVAFTMQLLRRRYRIPRALEEPSSEQTSG